MANADVDIANRALQMVGASQIESLTQDHPNARSMNVAYKPVRRKLIRKYAWSFAIKRTSVAADATKTLYGDLNRYALPTDYIRLLRNKETSGAVPGIGLFSPLDIRHDWTIEGDYIVTTDKAPLEFRYLADIVDPTLHDASFDEAFSAMLAVETVEEITQSNTKKRELIEDFKESIREARQMGAFEKDSDVPLTDDWLLARL